MQSEQRRLTFAWPRVAGVPAGFAAFCGGGGGGSGGGLAGSSIVTLTLRECALPPKAVVMLAAAITEQVRTPIKLSTGKLPR